MLGVSEAARAAACAKRLTGRYEVSKVNLAQVGPESVGEVTRAGSDPPALRSAAASLLAVWARPCWGGSPVTTSSEGSTVMAIRTIRAQVYGERGCELDCALSSIHCFVNPLGTARRMVPLMSPRGRAERSMEAATDSSSSVGTAASARPRACEGIRLTAISDNPPVS